MRETRQEARKRIHKRIRKKVHGSAERPRLCIFKSNKHIYAQIINDETGNTLVASSTLDPELRKSLESSNTVEAAFKVGEDIAKKAKAKGINSVVYDRGGYIYHGKVKSLADAARQNGLEF
ncbi:MAG: 50S ribosomal protein L18 [Candidatus Sericytochromatia bacterium]|nr:MAG: 50S ribosomal protein L18 [Candidatus Sericytochromatia bacterium]